MSCTATGSNASCYSARGRGATTELMIAASRGDYTEAARLLPGADLNARDAFGNTALIYAAGAGTWASCTSPRTIALPTSGRCSSVFSRT